MLYWTLWGTNRTNRSCPSGGRYESVLKVIPPEIMSTKASIAFISLVIWSHQLSARVILRSNRVLRGYCGFICLEGKLQHVLHQQLQYSTAMAGISDIKRRSIVTNGLFSADVRGYTTVQSLIIRHNIVLMSAADSPLYTVCWSVKLVFNEDSS